MSFQTAATKGSVPPAHAPPPPIVLFSQEPSEFAELVTALAKSKSAVEHALYNKAAEELRAVITPNIGKVSIQIDSSDFYFLIPEENKSSAIDVLLEAPLQNAVASLAAISNSMFVRLHINTGNDATIHSVSIPLGPSIIYSLQKIMTMVIAQKYQRQSGEKDEDMAERHLKLMVENAIIRREFLPISNLFDSFRGSQFHTSKGLHFLIADKTFVASIKEARPDIHTIMTSGSLKPMAVSAEKADYSMGEVVCMLHSHTDLKGHGFQQGHGRVAVGDIYPFFKGDGSRSGAAELIKGSVPIFDNYVYRALSEEKCTRALIQDLCAHISTFLGHQVSYEVGLNLTLDPPSIISGPLGIARSDIQLGTLEMCASMIFFVTAPRVNDYFTHMFLVNAEKNFEQARQRGEVEGTVQPLDLATFKEGSAKYVDGSRACYIHNGVAYCTTYKAAVTMEDPRSIKNPVYLSPERLGY